MTTTIPMITIIIRDLSQRRRKGLTTAFATQRNWDDYLLSTVKLRYATMVFRTAFFWRDMQNTILGLGLSLFIGLLRFTSKTIDFKT